MIKISIVYASVDRQKEIFLEVEPNCNVAMAIRRSGMLDEFPEIDLPSASVGVFSRKVALDAALTEGDRIEIYRPLVLDPKAARLLRAQRAKK